MNGYTFTHRELKCVVMVIAHHRTDNQERVLMSGYGSHAWSGNDLPMTQALPLMHGSKYCHFCFFLLSSMGVHFSFAPITPPPPCNPILIEDAKEKNGTCNFLEHSDFYTFESEILRFRSSSLTFKEGIWYPYTTQVPLLFGKMIHFAKK